MSWEQSTSAPRTATPAAKMEKTEQSDLAQITISTRLPEFWTDQPRLWFAQFEAILANQKRGEETKYNLVITKLNKESIQQVADLITKPPEEKPYIALKERLLAVYEESESRKIQKLLSEVELGDQKPSQLLRNMKNLAREKFPDDTLRVMWIGHLPTSVRAILTVSEVSDVEKLAQMADKMMETTKNSDTIVEVATSSTASSNELLIAEIAKINRRLDEMNRGRQQWREPYAQRSRSRSASSQRGNTGLRRRSPEDPDWLCYFHFRFGNRATRCEQPCSWKKEGQNATRHNSEN